MSDAPAKVLTKVTVTMIKGEGSLAQYSVPKASIGEITAAVKLLHPDWVEITTVVTKLKPDEELSY